VKRKKDKPMCIYKQASATAYDDCYICDGYKENCASYQIQIKIDEGYYYAEE
jgi:hypothetical protein